MAKYLSELFEHMNWADSLVWKSVIANPECEKDEKIHNLLVHLHLVQRAFFCLWAKEEIKIPEGIASQPLLEIRDWANQYHKNLSTFLRDFEDSDLDKPLFVPWTKRLEEIAGTKAVQATIEESMVQVTSHSTYHRGQINKRLRELGSEPPLVDFIAWVWLGKPCAEWPED